MEYSAKNYIKNNFSEYKGNSIFYTRRHLIENFFDLLNINLYTGQYTQEQIIYLCLKKCTEEQAREVLNKTPFLHF